MPMPTVRSAARRAARRAAAALALVALAAGCRESTGVPDQNNPSVESAGGALTPGNLQLLLTGLLDQDRRALDYPFLVFPGTLARDVLRLDNSDPRFQSQTLEAAPARNGFVGGDRGYAPYYVAVRAANNLLAALPRATAELSAGDTAAVGGFVRTLKAHDLHRILELRDTTGLAVAVEDPDALAPIRCKPAVLAYLAAVLDTAHAELASARALGTTTFPATLPGGWTSVGGDYAAIDNLLRYNRGLAGKIAVYAGLAGAGAAAFQRAVAALDLALAGDPGTTASLARGPYWQFSTVAGDVQNPLFDARIHFQPSVFDSLQAGDRRAAKIVVQDDEATLTVDGFEFATRYDPAVSVTTNSANQTRPIPILKHEELYLLRAQARIGLGDLAGAAADLNVVRTAAGGLAPHAPFATPRAAIDALLYEKRYSLLTDGPQRLVDLRAYGRLNATSFPPGTQLSPYAPDPFVDHLPIPQSEFDARGGAIACQP